MKKLRNNFGKIFKRDKSINNHNGRLLIIEEYFAVEIRN